MRNLIIYLLIIASANCYSQELNLPVFTQYLADNHFVISPTYAGIGDNIKIRANGLTQWVGIKNAPDNQSIYGDIRIADRSGVGLSLYNDRNGNTIQRGAKFTFAHHLVLDDKTKQFLSFGASYNMNSFKIDIQNFDNGYDTPVDDPAITDDRSQTNHNFDFGVLYRKGKFWMSVNANNILTKDLQDVQINEPGALLNMQLYTGFTYKQKKTSKIEFEPSLFIQYFASDQRSATDLNMKVRKYSRYGNYIFGGLSYRFLNDQFGKPLNIGPMAGIKHNKFFFAYAYQITTNELMGYNSGTHVITIGLDFFQGISNCPCTKTDVSQ